jgi:hypothetical protein
MTIENWRFLGFRAVALMMDGTSTSETSVNFYLTTRRYNPEDSHLHTRRRENLKSHLVNLYGAFCLATCRGIQHRFRYKICD